MRFACIGTIRQSSKELRNAFPGADTSKAIRELQYLSDKKCISGVIYFFGAGFTQTISIMPSGAPDPAFRNFLKKFTKGTKIAFEKYFYLNERGEKIFISKIFVLP